jgi:hypothetical protein
MIGKKPSHLWSAARSSETKEERRRENERERERERESMTHWSPPVDNAE